MVPIIKGCRDGGLLNPRMPPSTTLQHALEESQIELAQDLRVINYIMQSKYLVSQPLNILIKEF